MPDANPPNLKFAAGRPVPRRKDPVLLRGEGRYADDVNHAGRACAVMNAQVRRLSRRASAGRWPAAAWIAACRAPMTCR